MVSCQKQETMEALTERVFQRAALQMELLDENLDSVDREEGVAIYPRSIDTDGSLMTADYKWWCSGFYPGSLWLVYEYTGDEKFKDLALKYQAGLEPLRHRTTDHDIGFQLMCSFGNNLRLTGDSSCVAVLLDGARSLATRFDPEVGCTRSWDNNTYSFPVIIDNMMNLELLLKAVELGGDDYLKNVAVTHAQTTMKNHFREDASCWHVVDYDPQTGGVVGRMTWQGYNDDSTWARGEGWALYGYSMCYRETGNQEFLDHARKVARYILDHPNLPGDMVVYWDFDDPDIPNSTRDVSAAAVMASAFYELSTLDQANAKEFKAAADTMVKNIYDLYREGPGNKAGFILDHSRGARKFEIDVPLVYADYYFLEALLRKRNIENK